MADGTVLMCTGRAPTNIAVIKYWGKRDEELILPLNSSISVTLDPSDLAATTTVAVSSNFAKDRLWLNGEEVSLDGVRYQNCLRELRERAGSVSDEKTGLTISREDWQRFKIHIASANNFPTAAGLASSAAGFACLVFALAQLMGVQEKYLGELSSIARRGSGSACRSLYGGFVKWNMGKADDGSDSLAVQLAEHSHWPELQVVVVVASDKQKETSSTSGMQDSVRTSKLLQFRAKDVVPERMTAMEAAIASRDFPAFASITCADSNQFHATCLDTSPPIFYLNETSKRVIGVIERWNRSAGTPMAAYTFDAGPNAVLFVLRENASALLKRLLFHFPPLPDDATTDLQKYVMGGSDLLATAGIKQFADVEALEAPQELTTQSAGKKRPHPSSQRWPGEVQYLICTTAGEGPRVLNEQYHLLDPKSGLPQV